ncbi:aminopeptidase N [Microvirgula sp. AG722]|uniref:aminopeptidase N n=1 Tax=Microvirgula TaxID=57479 RepID=UPI000DC41AAC|nr:MULTISPECIES: aminopeptidase N [Microvirgula]RAS19044.1 aminopeptidase N [Microvirgula sp. AG722]
MSQPQAKYRADYLPSAFLIDSVDLTFDLRDDDVRIDSRMTVRRNPAAAASSELVLDGTAELVSVTLDGEPVAVNHYSNDAETLTLRDVPESFILEIATRVDPYANSSLMGLYASNGNLFTQCEPEGFRKITYYLDRPDVMAKFSTTIIAERNRFPVLLSNGNKVGEGQTDKRRHWVKWVDPYRKPSYLFALVAARLSVLRDEFVTRGGKKVTLEIWVEPQDLDKSQHAMESLKRAMDWDERRFGLEYDLDTYMIVAVGDFNMGAMENKGLNVFNTKYVLASRATATDTDFDGVEGVIGHEYFHNWTGNRVTCRDWFQLSLKEGLTVFRDQEFSADMGSRAVKRIGDVRNLRAMQFPEDAGPMSHPIRPESYLEMNNFYTMTVYEKGAEVVRMYHTLFGEDGFRRGMDLYFKRHDGQAVTCDDFRAAMADANGADLTQFGRWYSQAGTPEVKVSCQWSELGHTLTLTVSQSTPPTPGQADKLPLHIPLAIGLLDPDGREFPLTLSSDAAPGPTTRVLSVQEATQHFTFINIDRKPVPSLLRGFSAPVRLTYDYSDSELAFLLAHDRDDFARWEAGQQLAERMLLALYRASVDGLELAVPDDFICACRAVLVDTALDPAFVALALVLPSENELLEKIDAADPERIRQVRAFARAELARQLRADLIAAYELNDIKPFSHEHAGQRELKNLCLGYLAALDDPLAIDLAVSQCRNADNMTDQIGALNALRDIRHPDRDAVFNEFAHRWIDDALVMDKWFALNAASHRGDTLQMVQDLLLHPAFSLRNPNKARALLGSFGRNIAAFHREDGAGYRFMADQVLAVDAINPQVAARLVAAFNRWKRVDPARRQMMQAELERLIAHPALSKDVYEIVEKNLA